MNLQRQRELAWKLRRLHAMRSSVPKLFENTSLINVLQRHVDAEILETERTMKAESKSGR